MSKPVAELPTKQINDYYHEEAKRRKNCKRGQYLANLSPLPGVLCVDLTGVVLFNLLSVLGFFLLVGVGVSMVELSFGLLKWAGVGGII